MSKPLDELYFTWLYSQVGVVDSPDPNAGYWKLMKLLYTTEFVWTVPNDDNRAEDGRALRIEFLQEQGLHIPEVDGWLRLSCDMLELTIALSRRLAFEGDGHYRDWFWTLMENLGIHQHRDGKRWSVQEVGDILDRVIWRTYQPNGHGGLFPMQNPTDDQRGVELWYQMCSYLLERD